MFYGILLVCKDTNKDKSIVLNKVKKYLVERKLVTERCLKKKDMYLYFS